MRTRRWLAGSIAAVAAISSTGIALAADPISGSVASQAGGPIQGARINVAGPQQPPIETTSVAGGGFSLESSGSGPYSVGASASGFASDAVSGFAGGALDPFVLRPATFIPLPVFGGAAQAVVADARSGIFYVTMNAAPEVYRTVDHGGTWQPVTMGYDSPANGLDRPAGADDAIATSGVSGEVAVTAGGAVEFSTDYGLTWRPVGGGSPLNSSGEFHMQHLLFWAHAGSDNVLIEARANAGGAWEVRRADMSAASPTFVNEPSDPFGTASAFTVAESGSGAFVGRVSAGGDLTFAPLHATGPFDFGPVEASGLPSPPWVLRLGGAKEAAAPPDGLLAVGGSTPPGAARMLTKPAGTASFADPSASASDTTSLPADCQVGLGVVGGRSGSVAPTTTGDSGAAQTSLCWLEKSGAGPLTAKQLCCDSSDAAFDAGWGTTNNVMMMGLGPAKAATFRDDGAPNFNPTTGNPAFDETGTASPGTAPDSGGVAVNGLVSPVVADIEYGPETGDIAVAISSALTLASKNGGTSFQRVIPRGNGSRAAQWWQGASGDWLVFGAGQLGNLLTAVHDWDGTATLANNPNVAGSEREQLGDEGGGYGVETLAGVPGTDTVFIGLGWASEPDITGDNHIYRARLVDGSPPSLTDKFSFDAAFGGIPLYLPTAMEYCPASSANSAMRDVLFVATGDATGSIPPQDTKGSLVRITGATSGNPGVAVVPSVAHDAQQTMVTDVRADCDAGVVYTASINSFLYKSTDGGQTFAVVPIPLDPPTSGPMTAVGLNPADADEVTVATFVGTTVHSSDGGATWTLVNDPTYQRKMAINDIEVPPATGGGASRARVAASAPSLALGGTGGGAFKADLSASGGIIGLHASASEVVGAQLTNVVSDATPAVAVDPQGGGGITVFQRTTGLAYSVRTSRSWSLPLDVPGTLAGDREPALVGQPNGTLLLAFRRPGGTAPGIYLVARAADGAWSPLRRISKRAGDRLPSIAMGGSRAAVHVAFQRTKGTKRGILYASDRTGRWRVGRVRGTGRTDTRKAGGGPSLALAPDGKVHLAFARAKRGRGIYYAAWKRRGFDTPLRLTSVGGDSQPALVVASNGVKHLVFRRTRGRGAKGLFVLTGGRRWKSTLIPGTSAADTQPRLTINGTVQRLAFARSLGADAGIYADRRRGKGRWLPVPIRRSNGAFDATPAIGADNSGRVTIVYDRD